MRKNFYLTKIAQRAFERLQATHKNFDRLEVWCSIQSILVSAANISRILWPSKNRLRGKRLREMLNVEADNILSNRKFRNHFEHYDERIEEWFAEAKVLPYSELKITADNDAHFDSSDFKNVNQYTFITNDRALIALYYNKLFIHELLCHTFIDNMTIAKKKAISLIGFIKKEYQLE